MKIQPDRLEGVNAITRLDAHSIWVNAVEHAQSVLVPWRGTVQPWRVDALDQLGASHFEQVLSLKPEIVIFGSGARLRFVPPALHRVLIQHGVGMETMDTGAACRTYNVLAMEGRSVVAALLIEKPPA